MSTNAAFAVRYALGYQEPERPGIPREDEEMRDHRKLRAFELADQLALGVYQQTAAFPKQEQFGLTSQMRRAAVSVASDIVEGCARQSEPDYLRFLDMAYAFARELEYQISLASRLEFLDQPGYKALGDISDETCRVIRGLIRALREKSPPSQSQASGLPV